MVTFWVMNFAALLRRLRKKYSSIRAFAEALGIDPSHLSRAMRRGAQPFDIRGCLRVARVTGEDPGLVLRAGGKEEIAVLIEELYGPAAAVRLGPEQRLLLEAHDQIQDAWTRRALLEVARGCAGLVVVETTAQPKTPPPLPPAAPTAPDHLPRETSQVEA